MIIQNIMSLQNSMYYCQCVLMKGRGYDMGDNNG